MNKKELLTEVNTRSGLTKKDCKICLDVILNIISDVMKNGDSVTLSNFGKFTSRELKSKSMYNFKSGRNEVIGARKIPAFTASENLKQIVK